MTAVGLALDVDERVAGPVQPFEANAVGSEVRGSDASIRHARDAIGNPRAARERHELGQKARNQSAVVTGPGNCVECHFEVALA
jgi:hypothetical protein